MPTLDTLCDVLDNGRVVWTDCNDGSGDICAHCSPLESAYEEKMLDAYCVEFRKRVDTLFTESSCKQQHLIKFCNGTVNGETYIQADWGDQRAILALLERFLAGMKQKVMQRVYLR